MEACDGNAFECGSLGIKTQLVHFCSLAFHFKWESQE